MIEFLKYLKSTVLLCFLSIAYISNATNYYVTVGGSGTGTGIDATNKSATLQNIFTTYDLGTGDIIYVDAGTYTETGIVVGSNDEAFTIQGAALSAGIPTTIFDAASTARWLLVGNALNDNITINNIYIKDHKQSTGSGPNEGGGGVKVITGATGLSINYCYFDNCDSRTNFSQNYGGGIYASEGISVSNCTFLNCNAEYNGGAIAMSLSPTTGSNISYCTFYSNLASNYGAALYYGISSTQTLTFTNNLVYSNQNSGGGTAAIVVINTGSTLNITNCTITKNGNASIGTGGVLALSSAKCNIVNSIIYDNLGSTYDDVYNNTATVTMKNSFYKSQNSVTLTAPNSTTDPLFTNAATNDYTLQASSTAVDYGTLTGAPSDDILSYTRTVVPDAGAFEYGGAVPLPISLINFEANLIKDRVLLSWQTETERNNDYFTVEKTLDGIDYEIVGIVHSNGNSITINRYVLNDFNLSNNIIYYRLKQTDFDGNPSFSKLISVDNRGGKNKVVGVYNVLGQEVNQYYHGVVIVLFDDGSTVKKIQ
jgi:hypothetical protein